MPTFDLDGVTVLAPAGYAAKMVVLQGPPEQFAVKEQRFLRNVVIAREPVRQGVDGDAYCKTQLGMLAQSAPGFQRTAESRIQIEGVDCPLIEARCHGPEGMLLTNLIAYYVHDGVALTLSATHLSGPRYEAARAEFVRMFEQVTVR